MTSRPSSTPQDFQDDELLQEALRRFASSQPAPPRSAWTYRLALLGFALGAAAFVMEAISLSRGVAWSDADDAEGPAGPGPRDGGLAPGRRAEGSAGHESGCTVSFDGRLVALPLTAD